MGDFSTCIVSTSFCKQTDLKVLSVYKNVYDIAKLSLTEAGPVVKAFQFQLYSFLPMN